MDTFSGYDTVTYREPAGVFAGIAPLNFPGMIPPQAMERKRVYSCKKPLGTTG